MPWSRSPARLLGKRVLAALAVLLALLAPPAARGHGVLDERIAALTARIEQEPSQAALYLERGELQGLHGDWDQAEADFDRAAALDPTLAIVDLCRGSLLLARDRPASALDALDRFLASDSEHGEALFLKGRALAALGKTEEAARAMASALQHLRRLQPDHYLERAKLLTSLGEGRIEEALACLAEGRARLGPSFVLEKTRAELEARWPAARSSKRTARPISRQTSAPTAPAPAVGPADTPSSSRSLHVAIPKQSVWKYNATGIDLGTNWRGSAYDDGSWPSGPGVLGYGEPFIDTVIPYGPDPNNRYPTSYFRILFAVVDDPADIQYLILGANYDDGFVAYLNGSEIVRRSMPTGPISYGTFASSHEGGAYEVLDLSAFANQLVLGTNLLAVEVHQATPTSNDLVMDMELTTSTLSARVTRGPYLQIGTPSSMIVRWRTDVPTDSRVLYGDAPGNLTSSVTNALQSTEHTVLLSGLSADTRHYYAIGTSQEVLAGDDSAHFFVTSPIPGTPKPTRLWMIGDSGAANQNARDVRDAYLVYAGGRAADVWLMLGDNAYQTGTDLEYQAAVFDMYPEILIQSVLWPTRGNHDHLHAGGNNDYYEIFSMPTAGQAGGLASGTEAYYSYDHGNLHLICLDSEGSNLLPGGAMLTWLEADLAATTQNWILAYWHHPPYSKGSHNSDDGQDSFGKLRDMRRYALPILEEGGVDLVFCGHSHSYERSFLLDGHYGESSTLLPEMIIDGGDGRIGGDGAYEKPSLGPAPHEGAVYTVAGSSSVLGGGLLNHPVMVTSLNVLGSVVVDVEGQQLDALFLDSNGTVRDYFTVVKGTAAGFAEEIDPPGEAAFGKLSPGKPNPFVLKTRITYSLPEAGPVRLSIHDAAGRQAAILVDGPKEAGHHEVLWDGRDAHGRPVPAGIYLSRLDFNGGSTVQKILVLR